MNRTTFSKINLAADRLHKIHENLAEYKFIIPLLDEPYQLALQILKYPELDDREVAAQVGINWQTVKQIRRALKND